MCRLPRLQYRCGADVSGRGGILLRRQFIPHFAEISRGFYKFPVLQGIWIRRPKERREFEEFHFHIKMIQISILFPVTLFFNIFIIFSKEFVCFDRIHFPLLFPLTPPRSACYLPTTQLHFFYSIPQ